MACKSGMLRDIARARSLDRLRGWSWACTWDARRARESGMPKGCLWEVPATVLPLECPLALPSAGWGSQQGGEWEAKSARAQTVTGIPKLPRSHLATECRHLALAGR
jgi:hypothetical protein